MFFGGDNEFYLFSLGKDMEFNGLLLFRDEGLLILSFVMKVLLVEYRLCNGLDKECVFFIVRVIKKEIFKV